MYWRIAFAIFFPFFVHSSALIESNDEISILSPAFSSYGTEKLILDNGLQVYLISDPNTEKSAAALSVNVGSWNDPKEYPGLAHFLEHMLFLGTKKYPKESEFQKFVNEHAGNSNAFTQGLFTTYLFDVDTQAYEEALDRFSEFFKEPLFNSSGVRREKHAVHNEHSGNINNDILRRYRVWQELGNPKHPGNSFSTGNLETLKGVTTKQLRKWYEEHYSANLMTLVVYSPLPLQTLQELIVNFFSDIPNYNKSPFQTDEPLMQRSMGGHIAYLNPKNENQALTLAWEVPKEFTTKHLEKPAELLCYVLGHEGEKSLLAQLKREGLAEGLTCGILNWLNNSMMVYLQVTLTSRGAKNSDQVIERCFRAISGLRKEGIPEYLFNDIKKIETLKLQFPSRKEPFEQVKHHIQYLQYIPLKDYPTYATIPSVYNPELYHQFLSYLTPGRCYIDLIANTNAKLEEHEKWYDIDYTVRKVSPTLLRKWSEISPHESISIPVQNPWISTDIEVIATTRNQAFPDVKTLIENDHGVLYFAEDALFLSPEVIYKVRIKSPNFLANNPEQVVMTELLVNALEDALNIEGYVATMAGYEYTIERQDDSLYITISGYSDKTAQFLNLVISTLRHYQPTPEKFEKHKEYLSRKYKSFLVKNPLKLGVEMFREVIYNHYVTEFEKAKVIKQIEFNHFNAFIQSAFDQVYTEMVIYGNLAENQAFSSWKEVQDTLEGVPFPKQEQPQQIVAYLPKNAGPFYLEKSVKGRGNAVIVGIEQQKFSFERLVAQEVLAKSIGKEFFDELRTRQQTAYLIGQVSEEVNGKLFNLFMLESHSHHPRDLLSRIELMIENYLEHLSQVYVTEETFQTIRSALIEVLKTPPENIREMGKELSNMAFKHEGNFRWNQQKLEALTNLTYERFLEITEEILGKNNRQRLAILIKGNLPEKDDIHYTKAKNITWLKEKSDFEN